MGPDLRVSWDDVCRNPMDFEKLIKLLLRRLYPDGQVIDGSGGDGGREFQVRDADGLAFYEAKSFTGRLTRRNPNRRSQVERSLASAARRSPNIWHLVVPIDHSPKELEWFDGLRARFPFIGAWYGQTWLEEQLAQRDDLVRYATQNKLLEYVRHYNLETAALAGGVPDLLNRHRSLAALADTISPHWRPVVGTMPDGTETVALEAKHPAAADEAPITISLTAMVPAVPSTQELRDRLLDSADLGTTVEIPGEFLSEFAITGPPELGLSSEQRDITRVMLLELPETDDLPTQTLSVYQPDSALPIASVPFACVKRTRGGGGARLVAYDHARTLELTTDVRPDTIKINLKGQPWAPVLPANLLAGIRLLRALRHPNKLVLTVHHNGASSSHAMDLSDAGAPDQADDDDVIQYIEDLAVIQDKLCQPFPLSSTVRAEDVTTASRLRRMIDGEVVPWLHGDVTVTLDPAAVGDFKAQFSEGKGWLRISYDDVEVHLGEHLVHTGPLFMKGVVAIDLAAVPDEPAEGEDVTAVFTLAEDDWYHAQLGLPPDESRAEPFPPGRARVSYAADRTVHRDA